MSADIVNLRQYRKQKARAAKETQAAENRARHGRTAGEESRQACEQEREERLWSGKRLERRDSREPPSETDS
jgi:hypothetical protein